MSKVNGGEATYTKTRSFKSEVEFELLVKGAGANSFVGLMTDLNKWATEYKYTPDYFRGDVLDPFLCRQLLLAVCLSGGFDTTEKLNAIHGPVVALPETPRNFLVSHITLCYHGP